MENASKALIMAASMLLSIMVISIGIVLFRSFSGSGADIINKIEQTQINEFNNQFYKFESQDGGLSAYDVVTITNIAKENNKKYDLTEKDYGTSNYVRVMLEKQYFETLSNDQLIQFLKTFVNNNMTDKYYISYIELNPIGRVNLVELKKY